MKLVVLDGYTLNPGDLSWGLLKEFGELEVYDRTLNEKAIERIKDATAVFTNKVIISREIIEASPELKYIGVMATGFNVVDLNAANQAGILVTNIPAYSTDSVAQFVFSFILTIANQVELHSRAVKSGKWTNSLDFSFCLTPQTELKGKILGIIGFGKIGQRLAEIALAFGMKVVFQNRSVKQNVPPVFKQTTLDELLSQADFVSLNCPLTEENRGFIDGRKLLLMKKNAVLINTGRGPLVNEHDLADALNNGQIAGAGLDVLSNEPPAANNPLLGAKNCYITPHIAWSSFEARNRLMRILAANFEAYLQHKPQNAVNRPKN